MPNQFFNFRGTVARLLALGLALVGARIAGAGDPLFPPLTGHLEGDVTPLAVPGAPQVHWSVDLQKGGPGLRTGELVVTGPDTLARVAVELNAAGEGTWRLADGRISLKPWLNGKFTTGAITVTGEGTLQGAELAGMVTLTLRDVDLGELVLLADAEHKYVRSAKGRVEGRVRLRLGTDSPFSHDGELRLAKDSKAVVLLTPSPGLLTSYVPEQVRKLYPGIEAIELGRTALEAGVLRLKLTPAGDAAGRSAVLRIEGHPVDPQIIAPLELDVNISGPVESLLRKALDSRLPHREMSPATQSG